MTCRDKRDEPTSMFLLSQDNLCLEPLYHSPSDHHICSSCEQPLFQRLSPWHRCWGRCGTSTPPARQPRRKTWQGRAQRCSGQSLADPQTGCQEEVDTVVLGQMWWLCIMNWTNLEDTWAKKPLLQDCWRILFWCLARFHPGTRRWSPPGHGPPQRSDLSHRQNEPGPSMTMRACNLFHQSSPFLQMGSVHRPSQSLEGLLTLEALEVWDRPPSRKDPRRRLESMNGSIDKSL